MCFEPIANGKTCIRAILCRTIATEPKFISPIGQILVYNEKRSLIHLRLSFLMGKGAKHIESVLIEANTG
jgi:hypothetical protein